MRRPLARSARRAGRELNARSWQTEAPLRMLLNNLDPEVAEHPEELVVYGGSGKAARIHEALRAIVRTLLRARRRRDAARPERQARRRLPDACRRAARADRELAARARAGRRGTSSAGSRREGLTMFGQMTAGSWIYIGTQGILQGTYQTFCAAGEKHFGSPDLAGRTILTAGLGGMGGAQPLAATMAGRGDPLRRGRSSARIERRLETRYLDEQAESLDDALARVRAAAAARAGRCRSALLGNAADVVPELVARGEHFDLVTDQTAAHDPLTGYVPAEAAVRGGRGAARARPGASTCGCASRVDRDARRGRCSSSSGPGATFSIMATTCEVRPIEAGVTDAFTYPGFVPAYIRPLFCRGIGPFRWAALSGDPADIAAIDRELQELFPDDVLLQRWLELAPERVAFQGLPARICWLGYGDRARGGPRDQRARPRRARVGAGRDRARSPRLRLGRLAVPRDRGDAGRLRRDRRLADPERAAQHRRGRDVGQRPPRRRRRDRQLDPRRHGRRRRRHRRRGRAARARARPTDPGTGVHAPRRRRLRRRRSTRPREHGLDLPMPPRDARERPTRGRAGCSSATSRRSRRPAGASAPLRGARARRASTSSRTRTSSATDGAIEAVGRMRDLPPLDGDVEELDGRGLCAIPGLVDCHTHACFAGDRVDEFALRAGGATLRGAARGRRRDPLDGRARRARPARTALARPSRATATGCCAPARRRSRAKSGYGLDRETELASLRAIARRRRRPDLARRARRPARVRRTPTRTSTSRSPRCSRRRRELAEAADVFLERGAFDATQARRYLEALPRRRARAAPPRRPVHRDRARSRSRSSSARARSTTSRRPATDGVARARRERRRRRAAAGERALPRPADAAGARARRRRRRGRARDRLQPRQRVLREPARRLLARLHAARARAGRGARGLHGQRRARPRPRRPDRPARAGLRRRPRAARRARLALPRLPPRRRRRRTRSSRAGASRGGAGIIVPMATQKQRRRRAKEKRHEYEYVYVDEEGDETVARAPSELKSEPRRRSATPKAATPKRPQASRRGATVAAAVVARACCKRGAALRPLIFLATVMLLGSGGSRSRARSSRRSSCSRSSCRSATSWTARLPLVPEAARQAEPAARRQRARRRYARLAAVVARRRATARGAAGSARPSSLETACRSSGSKRDERPDAGLDRLVAGLDLAPRPRRRRPRRAPCTWWSPSSWPGSSPISDGARLVVGVQDDRVERLPPGVSISGRFQLCTRAILSRRGSGANAARP